MPQAAIAFLRRLLGYTMLRYLISGSTIAIIDLALLFVLVHYAGIWYLASAAIAFVISFFLSFFMQKFFTFTETSTKRTGRQLFFFFAVAIANMLANAALMYLEVDVLRIQYFFAQILALIVIAAYTFFIYKRLIFRNS